MTDEQTTTQDDPYPGLLERLDAGIERLVAMLAPWMDEEAE